MSTTGDLETPSPASSLYRWEGEVLRGSQEVSQSGNNQQACAGLLIPSFSLSLWPETALLRSSHHQGKNLPQGYTLVGGGARDMVPLRFQNGS